jgi:hypothetical protein
MRYEHVLFFSAFTSHQSAYYQMQGHFLSDHLHQFIQGVFHVMLPLLQFAVSVF